MNVKSSDLMNVEFTIRELEFMRENLRNVSNSIPQAVFARNMKRKIGVAINEHRDRRG